MSTEDDTHYIVKFKENGQNPIVLVNEFVGNKIAQILKLPCPMGEILELNEKLLSVSNLIVNGVEVTAGLHFGTQLLKNNYPNPPQSMIRDANNTQFYPGIIVFDMLTNNVDKNEGNFLISEGDNGNFDYYMIDNGHCFGDPIWNTTLVSKVGTWSQKIFTEMADTIVDLSQFQPYIDRVRNISDDMIAEIINQIPPEWNLLPADGKILAAYLQGQRNELENIIEANKFIFKKLKDVEHD